MTPPRVLVAYSMAFIQPGTMLHYLMSLKQFTGCEVDYLHVTNGANIVHDFDNYDIVFHSYSARYRFVDHVSESYSERLRRFRGLKVMALQDEAEHTNRVKAAIKDLGIDVVLSVAPSGSLEYIYPRSEFPGVDIISVLTGYVPDEFIEAPHQSKPLHLRSIQLGYRARNLGGRYGQLGFEKYEIGRRMDELCQARGIKSDIAMDEQSRLYGDSWVEFIGNCRAMLGSESGCNVFDFDGSIEARYQEMTRANGGRPPTYEEFRPFIEVRDKEVDNRMISPRMFECAALRTPMVLFRGRYSDVLEPDEHYVPLEKDFSNANEVLESIQDLGAMERMAERAYQHMVASRRYSYRAFGAMLRDLFDRKLAAKAWRRSDDRVPLISFSGARVQDPVRAVLTEVPTPDPKTPVQFWAKDLLLPRIGAKESHKQQIAERQRTILPALRAMHTYLDALRQAGWQQIGTGLVFETDDQAFACKLFEKYTTYERELAARQTVIDSAKSRLAAPDLVIGSEEHIHFEGALCDEYEAWHRLQTDLLSSLHEDLAGLQRTFPRLAAITRSRAGLRVYIALQLRGTVALARANGIVKIKSIYRLLRKLTGSAKRAVGS